MTREEVATHLLQRGTDIRPIQLGAQAGQYLGAPSSCLMAAQALGDLP
jgi:hypothetical protein